MRTVANSLVGVVIVAVLAAAVQAEEYYVDPAGGHVHPYTNLAHAATNIQSALAAASATASATDIVWIAEGIYTATNAVIPAGGTNVLHVDKPMALRALGSAANTIVNGEGTNRCIFVTYDIAAPDNVFELNGITLSNAWAQRGAGIYYYDASGSGDDRRAGELYNSVITDCTATGDGGGIYGIGTYGTGKLPMTISNCVMRNCIAETGKGGALYVDTRTAADIVDSVFIGNDAPDDGVVMQMKVGGAVCLVERSEFRGNGSGGGQVIFMVQGRFYVRNCLFFDNDCGTMDTHHTSAPMYVYTDSSTIVSNRGGITVKPFYTDQYFMVNNCVVYHNVNYNFDIAPNPPERLHAGYTNNCTIPTNGIDNFYANGNITNAPTFVDLANGDLRLTAASYGINAGTNLPWMEGGIDLDGEGRIDATYGIVDMGCYELNYRGTTIMVQ